MKRILVPIDFSGDSINALEHAIVMSNKLKTHIRLIFVKKSRNFNVNFDLTKDAPPYKKSVEHYFNVLIDEFKHKYLVDGIFDYKVRLGSIYREITNQAKYDDAYVIVMGTHGVSGFEEYMIGSNAYRVVSNAPCPVITIRLGYLPTELKRIVIPLDISRETRQKVPFIAELATKFNAEIKIVGVRETNRKAVIFKIEKYCDQVYNQLVALNIPCTKEHIYGDNITAITLEYAKKVDAQLISIMTEQTEKAQNLWLGDYAQQMVNHSTIPVISIHNF